MQDHDPYSTPRYYDALLSEDDRRKPVRPRKRPARREPEPAPEPNAWENVKGGALNLIIGCLAFVLVVGTLGAAAGVGNYAYTAITGECFGR